MKKTRLLLGGRGYSSFYQKEDADGEIISRLPIHTYKAILADDECGTVISKETEDKVIVEYKNDHVAGVIREVTIGDKKVFRPFSGVFCIVWLAKKKSNKGRIYFLWADMKAEHYQYLELSSMGIESQEVMNLCNHLFSKLTAMMSPKGLEAVELIDTVNLEEDFEGEEIDG